MIEVLHLGPVALVGQMPLVADGSSQQLVDTVADPRPGVDAVGHVADRDLLDGQAGPEPAEHLPGDLTVQAGDAIGPRRQSQTHQRHVELGITVGSLAELHELVEGDATLLGERGEVSLEQFEGELIDAGRHRSVGGEDAAGAHRLDGLAERQATIDPFADAFQSEETGMTFVRVEHLRMDAERPHRPYSADTEHDFLAQAVLFVAPVQPVGHGDGLGRIGRDVRVEQVQRDPPHVDAPHPYGHVDAGEVDVDLDARRLDAERLGVDAFVAFALPPVTIEFLVEVTLRVEQPDGHQRHTEIGAGLEVIAGEHTQAARVLRQRLGDPEFGREVGDEFERGVAVALASVEPVRAEQCVVEALVGTFDLFDVLVVGRQRIPTSR